MNKHYYVNKITILFWKESLISLNVGPTELISQMATTHNSGR